ncbi:gamma-glutamyltranspeptidase / glutathione hydrolase [Gracilibacillus ureilyticus]|uniref:Glutathione hydrolase proenzyme n=1 Tax=Gracilibacillus ureilyticus TaxID=531814 RepID=A0A1H9VBJ6_9BACI|nr:gamma-glutamyltransferase [Gracilibacillus ureilyticus]SES18814.1 gamma-glutamyltranspeptidase / glutathione hydrolase [Gracilibacillus ureilyticus]
MSLEEVFKNQKAYKQASHSETTEGDYGMVSCAIEEAAQAGEQVLKDGGNAIDAVVAMQLALIPTEAMNTSIGAGGFIVYYDNEKKETKVINGHTKAPSGARPDLFHNENGEIMPFDERSTSPLSVGVPGIMRAMELALETYGSMPLERLIDPAIQLAEEEFEINRLWDRTLDIFKDRLGEEAKKLFVPNGNPLKEGDKLKQKDLAKALKIIREEGFKTVYEGELADAMVSTLEKQGGILTKEDLKNYKATIDEPFWGSYKDYDLAFPGPPNGGGFAVSQLLKILEPMDISQYGIHSWEKYHILAEMLRIVLADQQTHLGDPNVVDIPMEGLFHPDYIEERRNVFSFDHRKEDIQGGDPWKYQQGGPSREMKRDDTKKGMDTTHFTAVDRWGNIAACTSSIERIFGSGIMVEGYGFMLNNDLTDFNPEPGTTNELNANKFAVSSKSPTIVFKDGKPFFTLGSPGASTIVGSVVQVFLHVLEYKMDLREAIAETRIFNNPDTSMEWEDGINNEAMEKLKELGYKLDRSFQTQTADDRIGDIQAIMIDPNTGKLYGATDSPRPGQAIGLKKDSK